MRNEERGKVLYFSSKKAPSMERRFNIAVDVLRGRVSVEEAAKKADISEEKIRADMVSVLASSLRSGGLETNGLEPLNP